MESIDLELGELFDRDAVDVDDEGDDVGAATGAREDGAMEDGNADAPEGDDEVLSNLKNLAKGAAKKRVMRPQPKLDATRLKSDRGLYILPKLFTDVEFKGRGQEAHDLKLLMSRLEHWAHRLFPKLSFDDFIERLERLGSKKEIQTFVKRIRLDLAVLDSDIVPQLDEDDGVNLPDNEGTNAETAFDEFLRHEREVTGSQRPDSASDDDVSSSHQQSNVDQHNNSRLSQNSPSLSSDVQQRIERNRQLALQKRQRAERLAAAAAAKAKYAAMAASSQANLSQNSTSSQLTPNTHDSGLPAAEQDADDLKNCGDSAEVPTQLHSVDVVEKPMTTLQLGEDNVEDDTVELDHAEEESLSVKNCDARENPIQANETDCGEMQPGMSDAGKILPEMQTVDDILNDLEPDLL